MDPFAVQNGVIAELRFPRPLRQWNLNSSVVRRLRIYDGLGGDTDYVRSCCLTKECYVQHSAETVQNIGQAVSLPISIRLM
ncbi:hypothetical protein R69927_06011 [Paraburkholderia domus]|nr:hypothetical protein R69927_06011 [Paraburkholderia domus]